MKKYVSISLIVMIALLLSGCNVNLRSMEQSKENFSCYKSQMEAVLDSYGLKMDEVTPDELQAGAYRSFLIIIDETADIAVYLTNDATGHDTGREEVGIYYSNSGDGNLNVKLFVDIVNCVSGKEISEAYCEAFLAAPEENYLPVKSGEEKPTGKKIYKYEFLNFGEDWSISYSLNDDETEELNFCGLTK